MGANPGTIGTNSGLEVEATNGNKVMVNKTDGSVIIQNAPVSTTNTYLLTTDANGLVSKQLPGSQTLPPVILGAKGAGATLSTSSGLTFIDTGTTLTLPANSKYAVYISMLLSPGGISNANGWVQSLFTDTPTGQTPTTDAVGPSLASGLMVGNSSFSSLFGIVVLSNSSGSPKTYYYKGRIGSSSATAISYSLQSFGAGGESQIAAVPIN